MPAYFRLVGFLKTYTGGQAQVMVEPGRSVRESLAVLGIPSPLVAGVLLNEVLISKDYLVQEGELIKLIAVIGGGASPRG
jgi:sulfur carrier protein ThiS